MRLWTARIWSALRDLVASGATWARALKPSARLAALGAAIAASFPTVAFFSDLQALSAPACKLPVLHDLACRTIGLGGVPTAAQEEAFAIAKAQGCDGLRAFIASGGDNPRVEEASRLLATRRYQSVWRPTSLNMQYFATGAAASKDAAQAATAADIQAQAARACAPLTSATHNRLRSAKIGAPQQSCEVIAGRWTCTAEGLATCEVDQRAMVETCTPPASLNAAAGGAGRS